jgi:threonine/homoserine/homoserine lactone efflux protein
MDITALAALFLASTVNAALPGPCVLMTATRSAGSGWRAGAAITLGVLTADILLILGATAMMLGMLTLSASALGAMKWAGIAALVALAVRSLRTSARVPAEKLSARDGAAGLAVGLSSPYNLVFFLALLPQFLPGGRPDLATVSAMVAALLGGAAVAQAGAILVGLGCCRFAAFSGPWVDRACAACLLAIAAVAVTVPSGGAGLAVGPALVSAR